MRALPIVLASCLRSTGFEPPPSPPDDARSAIVAFETEDALEIRALDLFGPLSRPFTARGEPTMTILYIAASLEEIRIDPGTLIEATLDPKRSLPPFAAAFQTTSTDPIGEWKSIEELPDRLGAFRMIGFDVDTCLDLGGCFLSAEDVVEQDCRLPCAIEPPAPPADPLPPVLPQFGACPDGWTSTVEEGFLSCDPPARVVCAQDSLQRVDSSSCDPIGPLCPAGLYATDLSPPILYVDPAAPAGGNGSIAAPFSDIATALAAEGVTLALAKGVFSSFVTSRDVSLRGACAAETIILGRPSLDAGAVRIDGVTLDGVVVQGASAALEGVLALGPLEVTSGSLSLIGSAVRAGSLAVRASGGSLSIETSVIESSPAGAVWLTSGATAALRDSAIVGTRDSAVLVDASTIEVERALIERTAAAYVFDVTNGSSVMTADLVIRDSTGFDEASDGYALRIDRSNVELSRTKIARSVQHGIAAETSTVVLLDVFIDAVRAPESPRSVDRDIGQGVYGSSSNVTIDRLFIRDVVWAGLRAVGGTTLVSRDVAISGVGQPLSWRAIAGLHVDRSTVEAERVRISEAETEGVLLYDAEGSIADLVVERDGATPSANGFECGLSLAGRSDVTVMRARLERLLRQGLCVIDFAKTDISDYTAVGVGDRGLYVRDDARATAQRVSVDGAADGVVAFLNTETRITDLTVRNVHGEFLHALPETGVPAGRGVFNNAVSFLSVERFDISGGKDAGLHLGSRDSVRLAEGRVTHCEVGARIPFDGLGLLVGVVLTENGTNIERPKE